MRELLLGAGLFKSMTPNACQQDARLARDNDAMRAAVQAYEDGVERFIPGGTGDKADSGPCTVFFLSKQPTPVCVPSCVRTSFCSTVLMGVASILWERESYAGVEAVLQRAADFCSDHSAWRLNMGHTLYRQVTFIRSKHSCGGNLSPSWELRPQLRHLDEPTLACNNSTRGRSAHVHACHTPPHRTGEVCRRGALLPAAGAGSS